ncbi:MAG: NAD+ synthase [bacterium]
MKNKIIDWIKEQVIAANTGGIVIGLSGGIDSSVVAGLCKEAVGKDNLLALIMPSHSQKGDMADALFVAQSLDINTKAIDLSDTYDKLKNILPEANNLANANLKPRLRMLVLYYFANKLNYLVCGTGNKSELMVGYFTKYGDGGVDILPIGNLLKRDVLALAKELGIPEKIVTKPPTAGLWPGQTDEGEMGITYGELDDILERIENKRPQIAAKDKVEKVKEMIEKSGHKRIGAKVYR